MILPSLAIPTGATITIERADGGSEMYVLREDAAPSLRPERVTATYLAERLLEPFARVSIVAPHPDQTEREAKLPDGLALSPPEADILNVFRDREIVAGGLLNKAWLTTLMRPGRYTQDQLNAALTSLRVKGLVLAPTAGGITLTAAGFAIL